MQDTPSQSVYNFLSNRDNRETDTQTYRQTKHIT